MCRLAAETLGDGAGPKLFALAGAGGAASELAPLAEALAGAQQMVAIASIGTTDIGDTAEAMAGEVVALIRLHQPHGPYRLLGYSFGGLLALETARVLRDAGETVTFVGLVDSLFDQRFWPNRLFVEATTRRAALHARGLLGQPPGQLADHVPGRPGWRAGHAGVAEGPTSGARRRRPSSRRRRRPTWP